MTEEIPSPHFDCKLDALNAVKLAKKLVKKVSNEFSAKPNEDIKPISYRIRLFLSKFYMK